MKIQIRYDLDSVSPEERANLPSIFAGKVFPVIKENTVAFQFKQRKGRSTKFTTWWCLKGHCVIHKQRTCHGNKPNNTPKNNH